MKIILILMLISMIGIVSAEESCWVPEQRIIHDETSHTITVIDSLAWTEIVTTTEAYTIPAVTHTETVIDVPEINVPAVTHEVTVVDKLAWDEIIQCNGAEGNTCERHKLTDGTPAVPEVKGHKDSGWNKPCEEARHGESKNCILVPAVPAVPPNFSTWHKHVHHDAITHNEIVIDFLAYTIPAVTHQITVIDVAAIDVPAGTSEVYHPAISHTETFIDTELWIEIIPGYNDQTCLDNKKIADEEAKAKFDTDGDGIPDMIDRCPGDALNRCNERSFSGYTFGTSDCNRMAILSGKLPDPHAEYTMSAIAWEYKYKIYQMVDYCTRLGADMTIPTTYYEWSPE